MSVTAWIAVLAIFVTIAALIKKCEVRVTLLTAGIFRRLRVVRRQSVQR